jgi:serine/threonine protein kinase
MTAPELVGNLKNKYSANLLDRFSGFEADVWALGLLLYSMCAGTLGMFLAFLTKQEASIKALLIE